MKVEIVNQNLNSRANVSVKRNNSNAQQQNFTGISQGEKEIMNLIHHKKAILRMKKLEWLKGEIGGILITALGTGAVAPIFIGFNPFVRPKKNATPEEKQDLINTKLYTAMRQPISAGLAILFQASVQKYIDKVLDAIFNNPNRAKSFRANLDQSYLNTETYLKDNVKKSLAEKGIKKPSILASLFGKKREREGQKVSLRSRYDMLVNDKVEILSNKQLDDIAKAFSKDNKIYIGGVTQPNGSIKLNKARALDNESVAKLVNKQIVEYQKDAEKLIKTPEKIVEYLDKAETFINNEKKLKTIFANNPWQEIKSTTDAKQLKELYITTTDMLEYHLRNEKDIKIQNILKEILKEPEDTRAYKVQRTLNRIDYIKDMCKSRGGYTPKNYLDALIERNNVLHDKIIMLEKCKITDTASATENTIGKVIAKVIKTCSFKEGEGLTQSVLRNTDTFSDNAGDLKEKIYKDIAKGYKELVKNNYKSWNQVSKILVGVFITLPITCTALNWVYPRFMEIFFPKLAGAKKNKGAAQQAQQNTQQTKEVGGDK